MTTDIVEVVLNTEDFELNFDSESVELVLIDDGLELTVVEDEQIVIAEEILEILTNSEPGIPNGGLLGQILSKKSNTSFDVEWIPNVKITVGLTPPTAPQIGELWVDTN